MLFEFSLDAIGEVVLLSGSPSSDNHDIPSSEGGSSRMDFICDFRLSTDIMVGCLWVGAWILSELCLEAIFVTSTRVCSTIRIDDPAVVEKIDLTVGVDKNKY